MEQGRGEKRMRTQRDKGPGGRGQRSKDTKERAPRTWGTGTEDTGGHGRTQGHRHTDT